MKLDVPFLRQTDKKLSGTTVADMVLRYYGINKNADLFESILNEHQGGTDMPMIGRFFLQEGFDVEFVSCHPRIFQVVQQHHTQEERRAYLEQMLQFGQLRRHDSIAVENFIKYVDDGGVITVTPPTTAMVHAELAAGRPVIGFLTTNFALHGRPLKNAHYIVIVGYNFNKRKTYILDPVTEKQYTNNQYASFGGEKTIRSKSLFNGLYSTGDTILDEGSMLLIRKRV